MSGEYISREAALEAMGSLLRQHFLCVPDSPTQAAATAGYMDGVKDADIRLRSIPAADVVPVVRCRECVYYHDYTCDRWADGTFMEPTDYCSRAAKMDGGQDDV